ncbi:MAG: 3-deoxy-8-phosphooctulonate synthase [Planctomycetota bacterium]|jgi:2-dehydro-3-deoxyphosphooctonate aldolase (KDO 8-P synthase)
MCSHPCRVGSIEFGGPGTPIAIIAGPCVLEDDATMRRIGVFLRDLCGELRLPLVFKASFDKANRSSVSSPRGPGLEEGLAVLAGIGRELDVPTTTDVHEPHQAAAAAEFVDLLQVPAFLCRQTDLLVACARTGLPVNVKKGQFLSPAEMEHVVQKLRSADARGIMLTERGTFFGYQRLVNDFIGVADMAEFGRAATAVGVNALFLETHPDPASARSDAATQQPFEAVDRMLREVVAIRQAMEIVGTT